MQAEDPLEPVIEAVNKGVNNSDSASEPDIEEDSDAAGDQRGYRLPTHFQKLARIGRAIILWDLSDGAAYSEVIHAQGIRL